MAKIFYSVSGEGRGHATRVQTIVEDLRTEHEIVIYAFDLAYELLASFYRYTEVDVRLVPGLGFQYTSSRKLTYWKTGTEALNYLTTLPQQIHRMQQELEAEKPDLIITDFEPILPRAANRCGIPFISITHQHFLLTSNLNFLPTKIRVYACMMAQAVRAYYWGQKETVVSSFYFPPLKPGFENVKQIGVLLRREVLNAESIEGNHVVVYLRRFLYPAIYKALAECGLEVRIYGLGSQPSQGSMHFFQTDQDRFLEDLATSRALISTAGNQLLGEALFLKKPILAMPEIGNYEQEINAYFLKRSGAGITMNMADITADTITGFLEKTEKYRFCIDNSRLYGNSVALEVIQSYLPGNYDSQLNDKQTSLTRGETII